VGGHRQSERSESQGGGSNISAPARFLDEADRDDLDRLRGFDYRQISSRLQPSGAALGSHLIVMEIVGCRQAFAYDGHFIEASRQFGFTVVK
jgi:hypothetical protein